MLYAHRALLPLVILRKRPRKLSRQNCPDAASATAGTRFDKDPGGAAETA
jgi:hypothetical protein